MPGQMPRMGNEGEREGLEALPGLREGNLPMLERGKHRGRGGMDRASAARSLFNPHTLKTVPEPQSSFYRADAELDRAKSSRFQEERFGFTESMCEP